MKEHPSNSGNINSGGLVCDKGPARLESRDYKLYRGSPTYELFKQYQSGGIPPKYRILLGDGNEKPTDD